MKKTFKMEYGGNLEEFIPVFNNELKKLCVEGTNVLSCRRVKITIEWRK